MYHNIIITLTCNNTSHQSTRHSLYITVNMKPIFSQQPGEDGCPVLLEFNSEETTLFLSKAQQASKGWMNEGVCSSCTPVTVEVHPMNMACTKVLP